MTNNGCSSCEGSLIKILWNRDTNIRPTGEFPVGTNKKGVNSAYGDVNLTHNHPGCLYIHSVHAKFGLEEHRIHKGIKQRNYLEHLLGKINFVLQINPKDTEFIKYKAMLFDLKYKQNLNTIENITPVVDDILYYSTYYTGYTLRDGYFDEAELSRTNVLSLTGHDGDAIAVWDLNDAYARSDLMTTNFMWYDVVPRAKLSKCEF